MDSKIDPILFGLMRQADVKEVVSLPTASASLKGTIFYRSSDNSFWRVNAAGTGWASEAAAVGAHADSIVVAPDDTVALDFIPGAFYTIDQDQATTYNAGSNWPANNSGAAYITLQMTPNGHDFDVDDLGNLVQRLDPPDAYPSDADIHTLDVSVENGVRVGTFRQGRST